MNIGYDTMPKKGWKSVLVSESVYKEAKDYMERFNEEKGFKEIRSFAHLLDLALSEYLKNHSNVT